MYQYVYGNKSVLNSHPMTVHNFHYKLKNITLVKSDRKTSVRQVYQTYVLITEKPLIYHHLH